MLCFLLQLYLQNVDICDRLYGQPTEIEALLGYDFLEGRDWLLEQASGFCHVQHGPEDSNLLM